MNNLGRVMQTNQKQEILPSQEKQVLIFSIFLFVFSVSWYLNEFSINLPLCHPVLLFVELHWYYTSVMFSMREGIFLCCFLV